MRMLLYVIGAIIGYLLFFTIAVGSVVSFFQILKWLFK